MTNQTDPSANAVMIDYWNAGAGDTWATFQEQLDRQLEPLGLAAMRALSPRIGERVLDIGCGCGHTTMALANAVGPSGAVTGIDISRPMLEVARRRAGASAEVRPTFREADAQTADLGAGAFDAAFSRFGVMFFSDPEAAFGNIRRSLKPEGRLAFVCWRPFQDNLWMRAPMEAAQPFLPPSPPMDPTAPGPFAFADPARVGAILAAAGFKSVKIDPFDAMIGGSDVETTLGLTFRVGPLGAALRERPELADQVAAAVRAAIVPYDTADGVMMPAAVWIVTARAT